MMKNAIRVIGIIVLIAGTLPGLGNATAAETAEAQPMAAENLYGFTANSISGQPVDFSVYTGKALLIVNVASHCGNTPQYAGLQELHKKYAGQGLVVIGFPCNQFGQQEPGGAAEIVEFCQKNYGVEFPLMEKIEVNGERRHPLYAWLTAQQNVPADPGDVKWNFEKFLIGRDGKVAGRFRSKTKPDNPALLEALEKALQPAM